jgi:hypothetical protein
MEEKIKRKYIKKKVKETNIKIINENYKISFECNNNDENNNFDSDEIDKMTLKQFINNYYPNFNYLFS